MIAPKIVNCFFAGMGLGVAACLLLRGWMMIALLGRVCCASRMSVLVLVFVLLRGAAVVMLLM